MSDQISIEGKEYISSKRASELSAYAQDYIGQLARASLIDAQRVGGLWYVSMESLQNYKKRADTYKPLPPERKPTNDVGSLISFDGKDYISASRASKMTGYHQDYVGQLARTGTILSRQVGNRWYLEREGLLKHKKEKDGLLAAVQARSVGITSSLREGALGVTPEGHTSEPYFTYSTDSGDLIPLLNKLPDSAESSYRGIRQERSEDVQTSIPIRVVEREKILDHTLHVKHVKFKGRTHEKTIHYKTFGTAAVVALTVVVVVSFGFSMFKNNPVYAVHIPEQLKGLTGDRFTASAAEAFTTIGDLLEKVLVPELVYRRSY